MLPNYHVTDWIFWVAMFALMLGILYLLVQMWIRKIKDFDPKSVGAPDRELDTSNVVRHFFLPVAVTLLCIAALIILVIGQGSKATLENSTMAPQQVTNPAFTKAYENTAKELTPNTQKSLEAQRIEDEEQQKKAADEAASQKRQKIGESMADFRARILNREQPGANDAPATPKP